MIHTAIDEAVLGGRLFCYANELIGSSDQGRVE